MDSGTTNHLAAGKGHFEAKVRGGGAQATMSSGGTLTTNAVGVASLVTEVDGRVAEISLGGTRRVPGLTVNLLSVGQVGIASGAVLHEKGRSYIFGDADDVAILEEVAKSDAIGNLEDSGQYVLRGKPGPKREMQASSPVTGAAVV